jgi:hypothetical protein
MADAIEEPKYTMVRKYGDFEVRQYAPYLVAEVVVPGPAEAAGNQGFRILAGYIFGKNHGERKISMTAPVTQSSAPTKIAMTAPVIQTEAGGAYVVRFTMPREFTRETLPEPLDSRVQIREIPGGRFAVIRYSGSWSEQNYRSHLEQLEHGARTAGLRTTGPAVYARYNSPFTPWFLRRNEIWLRLE